jgi:hypothetical protein
MKYFDFIYNKDKRFSENACKPSLHVAGWLLHEEFKLG